MILCYTAVEEDIGKVERLQQFSHMLAPGSVLPQASEFKQHSTVTMYLAGLTYPVKGGSVSPSLEIVPASSLTSFT
jgi:hypothetical protein